MYLILFNGVGNGANQAIGKLKRNVSMIRVMGKDKHGDVLLSKFEKNNVDQPSLPSLDQVEIFGQYMARSTSEIFDVLLIY